MTRQNRALCLAPFALFLCCLSFGASAQEAKVSIDNFSFRPAELTIAPGATVIWSNGDDIPHTIVATEHAFKSKPLDSGDTFSFAFKEPGEYAYFCSLHPHMVGKIIVKAP